MTTQLEFEQFSPHHIRRGFPTRLRYLSRLAFVPPCYCPLLPFGERLGVALTTPTPVVSHYRDEHARTSMAHQEHRPSLLTSFDR
jgi:hypothetical protein